MREGARSFREVIRMEECGPTKTQEILVSYTDIVQSPLIELGLFAMGPQRPEQAGHRFDDLTEPVFALPKSLLGPSPIINIDEDATPTKHRAIVGSQWFSADLEPSISAVRSAKSAYDIVRFSRFEILKPGPHLERDVVRMDLFHPSPANNLAKRRSKIIEHTLVDVFNIPLWPGSPYERRKRLYQQTKLLLAAR